jgi:hypothetical protein
MSRSHSHNDLKSLINWTDRLIRPECLPRGENIRHRSKTNVTIVEHTPNAKTNLTLVESVEELRTALATGSPASQITQGNSQPILRLYIVEDLSVEVVELLGSRFNIDPLFFSTYAEEKGSFELMRLKVTKKHRKWFQISNIRGYHATELPLFNVHRTPRKFPSTRSDRIMPTKTAFWLDKDSIGDSSVGIVLVDPSMFESLDRFRDKGIPRPDNHYSQRRHRIPKAFAGESWCESIVDVTARYLESSSMASYTDLIVVYPAIITICAEWLSVHNALEELLDETEAHFELSSEPGTGMRTNFHLLNRLSNLQKYIPTWRKMILDTLYEALPAAARLVTPTSGDRLLDEVRPDLESILHKIEDSQARITRLMEGGIAEMQLTAARESLNESQNLARLSWLATIFIPLTFLSGLFSMSDSLGSLKDSFKTYFAVGIPLVICALVVARWGSDVVRYVAVRIKGHGRIPWRIHFRSKIRTMRSKQ